MAEIGVLEGYKHKEDVPDAEYMKLDNQLSFPAETAAQYHDVASGDTLSAISKKYYGDANKYMKIFEANKPMLSDPNKIYPGQKLRIPQ